MARGVNKVIVVGNLGADPDVRQSGQGNAIASLSVATTETWRDKQSGENQERTEWHRVKLFGRLAEVAGEYLRKGSQVYVEGSLRTSKYTDREGVERYSTEIIASDMQMLGSRQRDDEAQPRQAPASHSRGDYAPRQAPASHSRGDYAPRQAPASHSRGDYAPRQAPQPEPAYDEAGDDIPF